jgi:hypothetical protein
MTRDYSQPVLNESNGLYGPKVGKAGNVVPDYFWWNGWTKTPPAPVGSIDDAEAKITPWKPMSVTAPFDAETKEPIYIKQGVYKIKGSLDAAVAKGVEASGQDYSGAWEAHTESMWFDVQHQVAPAEESLKCGDCHATDGRLDFAALGYSEEKAAELIAVGAGLVEEPAAAAEAPAEVPETGGAPVVPPWIATALAGVVVAAAGIALRRFRQ